MSAVSIGYDICDYNILIKKKRLSVKEDREQVENSFWLINYLVSFIFSAIGIDDCFAYHLIRGSAGGMDI